VPAESDSLAQSGAKSQALRVLIIDDHTLFRSGLEELLDRRGIDVVGTAGDGEEGCQLAAERDPDVILLDVRMPGMGGLTVLERLKDAGLTTPVLSRERVNLIHKAVITYNVVGENKPSP